MYAIVDKSRRSKTPPLPPRASSGVSLAFPPLDVDSASGAGDATDATDADGSLIYETVGGVGDHGHNLIEGAVSPIRQQPPTQDLYATIEQTAAEMVGQELSLLLHNGPS